MIDITFANRGGCPEQKVSLKNAYEQTQTRKLRLETETVAGRGDPLGVSNVRDSAVIIYGNTRQRDMSFTRSYSCFASRVSVSIRMFAIL